MFLLYSLHYIEIRVVEVDIKGTFRVLPVLDRDHSVV